MLLWTVCYYYWKKNQLTTYHAAYYKLATSLSMAELGLVDYFVMVKRLE
jgi:hypothetical protein